MRFALTILCVLFIFCSCEKEHEEESRKFLSIEIDSSIVVAENPTAVLTVADLTDTDTNNDMDKLTITARGIDQEVVTITLLGSTQGLTSGSFYSRDGNSIVVHYPKPNLSLIANQDLGDFTLNITGVQDSLIEASFTGILIDTTGTIAPKPASFGFFRAIVKGN